METIKAQLPTPDFQVDNQRTQDESTLVARDQGSLF
jgi:hypothetical protein